MVGGLLQIVSTFSSGFPRPRTISCGLDHPLFRAVIESSDPVKIGILKRYLTIYLATNVGVNGSSQERPGSVGFWGFAGIRGRSGSGNVRAGAWSGRSYGFLIQLLEIEEHPPLLLQLLLPGFFAIQAEQIYKL